MRENILPPPLAPALLSLPCERPVNLLRLAGLECVRASQVTAAAAAAEHWAGPPERRSLHHEPQPGGPGAFWVFLLRVLRLVLGQRQAHQAAQRVSMEPVVVENWTSNFLFQSLIIAQNWLVNIWRLNEGRKWLIFLIIFPQQPYWHKNNQQRYLLSYNWLYCLHIESIIQRNSFTV